MRLRNLVLGAAVVVGAVHAAAAAAVRKIEQRYDRHTLEELLADPPGEETWIERPDGTRLRALIAGSGTPVVLSHGFLVDMSEWNLVAQRLAGRGYRVIAFDQRGHGGSTIGTDGIGSTQMAGDYAAILEKLDVTEGILVGHSMGGFLTVKFLLDHPVVASKRLQGVLLVSALAGDVAHNAPQNALQIPLLRFEIISRLLETRTYGWLLSSLAFAEPTPAAVEATRTVLARANAPSLLPILDALVKEDYYDRLGEIDVPCRLLCGTRDRTTPPQHSERLAAGIAGAELSWVQRSAHALNWEAVPEIVKEIEAFG